jgi:hypothetical protein
VTTTRPPGCVTLPAVEANEFSLGRYEIRGETGSLGQGCAFSHPTIGQDGPLGQCADLGCHFSQLRMPQFFPFVHLGALGWR